MNARGGDEFRLLVRHAGAPGLSVVPIPGPRAVRVRGATLEPGAIDVAGSDDDPCWLLHPVQRARHAPELLLRCRGGARPLRNGRPVVACTVLRSRDEAALPGTGLVCHVALYRARPVGPPPTDAAATCAVCGGAFEPAGAAYHCLCGALLHAPEPTAGTAPAEPSCATLAATCAVCGRPIALDAGYDHWPEDP